MKRLRDINLGLFFSSINSFTSYLFSLKTLNTKLNGYPEEALYTRHGSRSRKNIAQTRETKGDTQKMRSRMKRPVAEHGSKTGKLAKNIKAICLQTPIWKVSCHRSIISGLLGSFNGKWQGFSMACSESELRLVELFTFPGETKSLRKVKLGQLA